MGAVWMRFLDRKLVIILVFLVDKILSCTTRRQVMQGLGLWVAGFRARGGFGSRVLGQP